MKITVKNYLEYRSELLQSDNPKIVELAQGTDKDLIEVYGQDETIDDAIDTAILKFNEYLESKAEKATKKKPTKRTSVSKARAKSVSTLKAKRKDAVSAKVKAKEKAKTLETLNKLKKKETVKEAIEQIAKPKKKATKRTSVSKARAKSVSTRKATRKANVIAKIASKAVSNPPLSPKKSTSTKLAKELKATLDKGDVVKDKQLRKEIVVDAVNGSSFTGHEVTKSTSKAPAKSKPAKAKADAKPKAKASKPAKAKADSKPKAPAKAKEKAEKPKFEFAEGQLVMKGKMIFLVVNAKKSSVSLEEVDGKMLSNQSLTGFKAAPISKIDERISKEKKAISILESKIKNESEALRKLHIVASKVYKDARALGKMNSTTKVSNAEAKFDTLKSLIYQKGVLQAIHRKDVSALKVIAKKSNIDFPEIENSVGKKKAKPAPKKKFHLLKPSTWL